MKIGDYARTNDGLIAKLIKIDNEKEKYRFDGNIQWFYEYYRDDIDFEDYEEWVEDDEPKFADNIIDLIEVGDYVNGLEVEDIYIGEIKYVVVTVNEAEYLFNEDIGSIVTKEQFASMEYRIGDK